MLDYLIVGSGLYGATVARQLTDAGKKVLVIDKRPNIAGNVYTYRCEEINVHQRRIRSRQGKISGYSLASLKPMGLCK